MVGLQLTTRGSDGDRLIQKSSKQAWFSALGSSIGDSSFEISVGSVEEDDAASYEMVGESGKTRKQSGKRTANMARR